MWPSCFWSWSLGHFLRWPMCGRVCAFLGAWPTDRCSALLYFTSPPPAERREPVVTDDAERRYDTRQPNKGIPSVREANQHHSPDPAPAKSENRQPSSRGNMAVHTESKSHNTQQGHTSVRTSTHALQRNAPCTHPPHGTQKPRSLPHPAPSWLDLDAVVVECWGDHTHLLHHAHTPAQKLAVFIVGRPWWVG